MLFMGRRLAGRGDIAVWQEHSGAGYFLQFLSTGVVIRLDDKSLVDLSDALAEAVEQAKQPERNADEDRRLQILRARVLDHIQNAKEQKRNRGPR